ncbi:MAG: polysaccharide deacetylase family protein [Acetobacteraceae bacterium]
MGNSWSPTPAIRLSAGLHVLATAALVARPESWPWLLGCLAANHLLLGVSGACPRAQLLGPNLCRLPPSSTRLGQVALTFDDGPDPRVTPAVLDLLDRWGVKASFFCIGRRAAAFPALVGEIAARGHGVENHSHTHANALACYAPAALHRELSAAQTAIGGITGRPPAFFRPPMGLRSPLFDPVLRRLELRQVTWTRRGYDTVCGDPRLVLRRLARGLAAGDVLLLHDGGRLATRRGRPVVLDVLPALLDRIAAAGLRSVPLHAALT